MDNHSAVNIIRALDLKSIQGREYDIISFTKSIAKDNKIMKEHAIKITSEWCDYRGRPENAKYYNPPRIFGKNELTEPDRTKRDIGDTVTFQECVKWNFDIEKSILTIVIWEGDWEGEKKSTRCKFYIQAHYGSSMLELYKKIFEVHFKNALWNHIENARETELKAIEEAARSRIEDELFANIP